MYARIRKAFDEIVVPELRALQAEFKGIRGDLAWIRAEFRPLRRLMRGEIRRLDARIEMLEGRRGHPAACGRSPRGCRSRRRG